MPYLLVSTILNTTEGHTANPSLILTVIKREMVLFYFKLISSLRRQHHFIQCDWMAHSAIAEKLPFAYLTTTPRLTWCFTLKFSEPSLYLNWCVFHSGASSSFVTFRSRESQVVSLHPVNSCCSEGLCYWYSHSVMSLAASVCLATPFKQGTLWRLRLWLKWLHLLHLVHENICWWVDCHKEGKPGSEGERFSFGSDCPQWFKMASPSPFPPGCSVVG